MAKLVKKETKEKSASTKDLKGMTPLEKLRVLGLQRMEEKYKGASSTAGGEDERLKFVYVPDLMYQWALGRPGYAMGKIMTILGFEGASKTSNFLYTANLAIKAGGLAAMVETETAGSTEHMKWYLDEPDNFLIEKPRSLEQAMEMTRDFLMLFKELDPKNQLPKILGFDSVGGTALEKALDEDAEIGAKTVGGKGKFMSDAIEVIKQLLIETNTLWIANNQGKDKIHTNAMPGQRFADHQLITASGGHALPLASHYYVMLKKGGAVKSSGDKDGFGVKMYFMKNKLRFPDREIWYDVRWEQGLDFVPHTMEFLTVGKTLGMRKEGGHYWAEEAGISKSDGGDEREMYAKIHSAEYITRFQEALGVKIAPENQIFYPKGFEVPRRPCPLPPPDATNVPPPSPAE
jgi:RecA/RadA recombinase